MTKRQRSGLLLSMALPLALLGACSNPSTPLPDVGGVDDVGSDRVLTPDTPTPRDVPPVEDGPPVTGTPDGPLVDNTVTGNACLRGGPAETCGTSGVCLFERQDQMNGVCAATGCTMGAGDNCGTGYQCVAFSGSDTGCLKLCEPTAGGSDCGDPLSVCHPLAGYCTGACASDTECGTGYYCHPTYKVCFTAGDNVKAAVGDACAADTECTRNGVCAPEASGFTGGYCTVLRCDFDEKNFGCPEGSLCAPTPDGNAFCLSQCKVGAPMCREGYGCAPITGAMGAGCVPPQP